MEDLVELWVELPDLNSAMLKIAALSNPYAKLEAAKLLALHEAARLGGELLLARLT